METQGKTETRVLDVKLSREEIEQRARELAATVKEHDRIDAERKADAANAKLKLDELNAKIRKLSCAVELGSELQDVQCEWVPDSHRLRMNLVRVDTGAVVSTRDMTKEERQLELPSTGAN
jgi:hypothetical protein